VSNSIRVLIAACFLREAQAGGGLARGKLGKGGNGNLR
jgi:hypothetical protein